MLNHYHIEIRKYEAGRPHGLPAPLTHIIIKFLTHLYNQIFFIFTMQRYAL